MHVVCFCSSVHRVPAFVGVSRNLKNNGLTFLPAGSFDGLGELWYL